MYVKYVSDHEPIKTQNSNRIWCVKKYYKADESEIPLQGIGQGNAMGPVGWGIISSPLFEVMRNAGYGAQIITSISKTIISIIGYGFVEDVYIIQTANKERKMIKEATKAMELWDRCIKV